EQKPNLSSNAPSRSIRATSAQPSPTPHQSLNTTPLPGRTVQAPASKSRRIPTPSPPLSPVISDDDDDLIHLHTMSTLQPNSQGVAVVSMPSIRNPPVWSAGKIDLNVLILAQRHTVSYLHTKGKEAEKAKGAAIDIQTGFDANVEFSNWYQTNAATLNELDLDGFFVKAKERFLPHRWATQWASDIANTAQGEKTFKVWAEGALLKNNCLAKCAEQLSIATLIDRLTANASGWLKEALLDESEDSVAARALAVALCKGTADPTKGETFDAWISLVDKVERAYTAQFQTLQLMLSKRSASEAGIGKPSTTIPVAAAPSAYTAPPSYSSAPARSRNTNISTNTWGSSGDIWGAPASGASTPSFIASPYPDKLSDLEKVLLKVVAGCFTCRSPWQSHRSTRKGEQPLCTPCPRAGYVVRDITFIRNWIEKYPNGFNTAGGRGGAPQPQPTTFADFCARIHAAPEGYEMSQVKAMLREYEIQQRPPARPVSAVHINPGYVAAVSRRGSFPPSYVPYSNYSVVGAREPSFEADYDTSGSLGGDSPPSRNVKRRINGPVPTSLLPAPPIVSKSSQAQPAPPAPVTPASEHEVIKDLTNFTQKPSSPPVDGNNASDKDKTVDAPDGSGGTENDPKSVVSTPPIVAAVPSARSRVTPHIPVASVTHVPLVPLSVDPVYWNCKVPNKSTAPFLHRKVTAMIDSGSSVVLIRESIVDACGLPTLPLQEPIALDNAFSDSSSHSPSSSPLLLDRCVELRLEDYPGFWTSKPVYAIVSPSLVSDVILGMPFITTMLDEKLRRTKVCTEVK
ncbi:hypothetical protein V5O48_018855, partial [Marasmius crinis-equi]